ncbi:hypothetical protein B0I08_107110 [Glaciihabitans tibetensis]|uniref:Uncharacterized protein n=1 Tax=Glaciihabitans tibetensis TaxID=1266600 RepID=A0A2T0VAJ1_9MICO|nr:hypothetical protein B0I08_107110 [Glaciihabitans tibetensis]
MVEALDELLPDELLPDELPPDEPLPDEPLPDELPFEPDVLAAAGLLSDFLSEEEDPEEEDPEEEDPESDDELDGRSELLLVARESLR